MPPLPLASLLQASLPRLSPDGRALISAVACFNGRVASGNALAQLLGFRNRFQLGRALRREGLPSLRELTGWATVLHWLQESRATDTSLLQLAERERLPPTICYRLVRRVTGMRWRELSRSGLPAAMARFRQICQAPVTVRWAPRVRARRPVPSRTTSGLEPLPDDQCGVARKRVRLDGCPTYVAISAHGTAYVTRSHAASVERLDLASRRFVATIPVGRVPTRLAFDREGTRAYVANQFDDDVSVIDVARDHELTRIPVAGNPFAVAPSAHDQLLYVTTNLDLLHAVCLRSKRTVASLSLPGPATHLALGPSGTRLYASTRDGGSVLEVDTRTLRPLRTFHLGGRTQGLQVAPDRLELYVANERGWLDVIRLCTGVRVAAVELGGLPFALALSPDGRLVYVVLGASGRIAVVDRLSRRLVKTIHTGGSPYSVAFDWSGRTAVVTNEAGWLDFLG